MKKIFLLLFIFAFTKTQAQIPNNGFENWRHEWYGYVPDDWYINEGDFAPMTAFPDSMPYAGSLAIKMWNTGVGAYAFSRFAIAAHPQNLAAWVHATISSSDTVSIRVTVFHNNVKVDSGLWLSNTSIAGWTRIFIPITQHSSLFDSCEIYLQGGKKNSSVFHVDELLFDQAQEVVEKIFNKDFSIYPNPSSHKIFIALPEHRTNTTLTITDINGRALGNIKMAADANSYEWNVATLPQGIYFLRWKEGNTLAIQKFVKQ